jgi:uncharacterized protein
MGTGIPFVLKFRTQQNYYIYDVNTNRILLVNDVIYDLVDHLARKTKQEIMGLLSNKYGKREIESNYRQVSAMIAKHNIFSCLRPVSRELPLDAAKEFKDPEIRAMTLEVTQRCNLRCDYCSFSGKYKYWRVHNSKDMSFITAKKAIDFFYSHIVKESRDVDRFFSFYGGEPLLRFGLIKKCIEYLRYKNRQAGLNSHFISVSTNGYLINEEMIDFFIKERIRVQISLDGPRRQHDENRKLACEKGTFNKVIKSLAPYYEKYVQFNCTISPNANLLELNDYFSNEPLVAANVKTFRFVDNRNTSYFEGIKENEFQEEERRYLFRWFIENLMNWKEDKFFILNKQFEDDLIHIHKRSIFCGPQERVALYGPCLPGLRKLYVSADGKFHICEKINDKFPIGDVDNGFDFNRINRILMSFYKLANDSNCLDCWAMHFCGLCYAVVAADGEFRLDNRSGYCRERREFLLRNLVLYATIMEKNPKPLINKWNETVII